MAMIEQAHYYSPGLTKTLAWLRFLSMAMIEQAHHYSPGLTKTFTKKCFFRGFGFAVFAKKCNFAIGLLNPALPCLWQEHIVSGYVSWRR